MNKYSRSLFFAFLLLPVLSCLRAETVVVDFQKVFEQYRELQIQDQKLREEVAAFQQLRQGQVEMLQKKQQEFQALRSQAAQADLSDEDRKALVEQASGQLEELNRMEQELRGEQAQFQKDIEAKSLRLRRAIVDKVNVQVKVLAEEEGWDLVLDRSAKSPNGLSVVVHAAVALDKTEIVIDKLNAAAAVSETPAE